MTTYEFIVAHRTKYASVAPPPIRLNQSAESNLPLQLSINDTIVIPVSRPSPIDPQVLKNDEGVDAHTFGKMKKTTPSENIPLSPWGGSQLSAADRSTSGAFDQYIKNHSGFKEKGLEPISRSEEAESSPSS